MKCPVAPRHSYVYGAAMKLLALLLTCGSLYAASSQVVPSRLPPLPPGATTKVALTNVQTAMRVILVLDTSTALQSNPVNAEKTAYWLRSVADTFAAMSTNGNFLVTELDKVPDPLDLDLSALRATIRTLYGRAYEYRTRGDLPPLEWLTQVSKTFAESIREGIRQGGKAAIL